MSCFICAPKSIKSLAIAIAELNNLTDVYQLTGISLGKELYDLIRNRDCADQYGFAYENKIADMLYAENVKAYAGRYKDHVIDWTPPDFSAVKGENLVSLDNKWVNGHNTISDWYFRLLKLAKMYHYQISEDATYNGEICKAIESLIDALKTAIVCNDPRYHRGDGWGEWY